jgi:diguanylate cyclase (GGDEF)-like protein
MSLVTRIFTLIAVTLLLVAAGELWNGLKLRQQWSADVRGDTAQLALIAEVDMGRVLDGASQLMATLAKLQANHGWDERACTVLVTAANSDFEYDQLVAVDRRGTILCSSSGPTFVGTLMPDRELFNQIVSTAGFAVGSYGVGRISGNEVLRVGYPVVDATGTVVGAVYGGINLTWLNTAIEQWHLGEKASIDITDRHGTVVAQHPGPNGVGRPIADRLKPLLSMPNIGTAELSDDNGVSRLYGYVPVVAGPSDAIGVFVGRDRSAVFADINRSLWQSGAVVLMALLGAATFAVTYVRRMLAGPLNSLLSVAIRWRDGDWSARTDAPSGISEFDRLASAFDDMAGALSARDREVHFANMILTTMNEVSPDGILMVDKDNRITSRNVRFIQMFSVPQAIAASDDDGPLLQFVTSHMAHPDEFAARVRYLYDHPEETAHEDVQLSDGRVFDRHSISLFDDDRHYVGRIWFFRDVTHERAAHQRLAAEAHIDTLTGIANRRTFDERLAQAFAMARRNGKPFAVLALDLDHFKAINDTWGHAGGDEVLAEMGRRLRQAIRETDVVARIGGDEFAVLQTGEVGPESATFFAGKLRAVLARPYGFQRNSVVATVSVGIALYSPAVPSAAALLKQADDALYRAKEQGRDRYCLYEPASDATNECLHQLEAAS